MSAPAAGGTGYAVYRASGLGRAFVETLAEMFQEQELNNDQVIASLLTFDRVFNAQLEARSPANKLAMEGMLQHYRFCDGVWTLQLKDAKFTGAEGSLYSPNIKVVACEAKGKGKRARK
jgi:hypothetical protein